MNYGRLHWFAPDELTDEQRDYYDRLTAGPRKKSRLVDEHGRLYGAFNARLLDPAVGTAIQELGAALRFGTSLTPRCREIAILSVAASERCEYEWDGHVGVAREVGMTAHELDGLLTGAPVATLTPDEQVVRRVTDALIADRDIGDDLYREAVEAIGATRLFDVISLIGHYQHTALALRVWRTPMREGTSPVFSGRS